MVQKEKKEPIERYNELILAGGITTLSTDFKLMGQTMASLITKKTIETIENPWRLNIRSSL